MNSHVKLEDQVRRILRLCRIQVWLAAFTRYFVVLVFIASVVILALRWFSCERQVFYYTAALIPLPALIPAFIAAARMKLKKSDIIARLDRGSDAGGLIMSSFENIQMGDWDRFLESRQIVTFHANRTNNFLFILLAFSFLTVCFYIPIPERYKIVSPKTLNVKNMTEPLAAKVETLEQTGMLDKERADYFNQLLRDLENNKDAYDPGKIFETLDSVDKALTNLSEAAAKQMLDTGSAMEDIRMLAEKLEVFPDAAGDSKLRELAEALTQMLDNSNLPSMSAAGGLSMNEAMKSYLDTPPPGDMEKLRELAESIKASEQTMKEMMKKLSESGGLSEQQRQELQDYIDGNRTSRGTRSDNEQMRLTKEQFEQLFGKQNNCSACESGTCPGGGECENGEGPGRGGISRGRGDAPMIYAPNDTVIAEGGQKERLMSESLNVNELGESMGISFAAPNTEAIDDGAGGSLQTTTGSGGESKGRRLSPKERKTVEKFFASEGS